MGLVRRRGFGSAWDGVAPRRYEAGAEADCLLGGCDGAATRAALLPHTRRRRVGLAPPARHAIWCYTGGGRYSWVRPSIRRRGRRRLRRVRGAPSARALDDEPLGFLCTGARRAGVRRPLAAARLHAHRKPAARAQRDLRRQLQRVPGSRSSRCDRAIAARAIVPSASAKPLPMTCGCRRRTEVGEAVGRPAAVEPPPGLELGGARRPGPVAVEEPGRRHDQRPLRHLRTLRGRRADAAPRQHPGRR